MKRLNWQESEESSPRYRKAMPVNAQNANVSFRASSAVNVQNAAIKMKYIIIVYKVNHAKYAWRIIYRANHKELCRSSVTYSEYSLALAQVDAMICNLKSDNFTIERQ